MRLLYSAASPFARIVRIALLETGLGAGVTMRELTRPQLYSPESEILTINPIGRVPTLELEDGTILTESKLILDYLDAINPGPKLLPHDGSDGWRTMAEAGQAMGLLESIVAWLRVYREPESQQPTGLVTREATRANRAADALEAAVVSGAYSGPINASQIVLGVALALIEPRLPMWKWREGRPHLSAWFDTIAARPSFRATTVPPS